jgi:hypothetical protein
MGYSDAKFQSRALIPVKFAASLGTATGAGTASNSLALSTTYLPKFTRRTQVNKVRVIVTTIPDAAATAVTMTFKNGTSTFATVTLTTATAGQVLDGSVTAANAVFAADGQPTIGLIGTFTASGAAAGAYDIFFEEQELFS